MLQNKNVVLTGCKLILRQAHLAAAQLECAVILSNNGLRYISRKATVVNNTKHNHLAKKVMEETLQRAMLAPVVHDGQVAALSSEL
jgi:hypothetical protein